MYQEYLMNMPNVVFVFADQWRAQAFGYAGNPNVQTPNIDRFAAEGVNVTQAISGCPVCTPYRASLLTGQLPLTHGLFVNDVALDPHANTIGKIYSSAGYDTAYIGKWHVDGQGRSAPIPPERQQGFDYWKVLECTHDYNKSFYYHGASDEKLMWDGYDAIAQTRDAIDYLHKHDGEKPFLLMLSWGGPHAPYHTAPDEFCKLYDSETLTLRDNVPPEAEEAARRDLAGYYAHCSALDSCFGELLAALEESGLKDDTIIVFTSDHGDMIGSQNMVKKQNPFDESIRVPYLIGGAGLETGAEIPAFIDAQDNLPTLLGLCGIEISASVEGINYAPVLCGEDMDMPQEGVIACYHPFGQWNRGVGGVEYRGLRTERYTYARTLDGPWLLFDNQVDPYQMNNLIGKPEVEEIQAELDGRLTVLLAERNDDFRPGMEYIERWNYPVDESGTVPYEW
jgi:arylsulfatase A-like enzyme